MLAKISLLVVALILVFASVVYAHPVYEPGIYVCKSQHCRAYVDGYRHSAIGRGGLVKLDSFQVMFYRRPWRFGWYQGTFGIATDVRGMVLAWDMAYLQRFLTDN